MSNLQLGLGKLKTTLLATEIESVPRGRGCFLAVEFQPMVSAQVRTQVWKCPSVGFWMVMQRWCAFLFGAIDRGRWSKQASDLFKVPLMSAHWCEHDGSFSLLGLQFVARSMWQISSFVGAKVLVQLSAIVGVVQKRAIKDEKERLRKWARDAVLGGAREAHRYLKKSERIPLRPFGHLPLLERAEARRKYWLNIWQERVEPGHLPEAQFQQIKNLAVAQAAQLKGISSRQISMTFADMANTRPGLEGFHFRDIRGLPSEAFSALSWMDGQIESTGCWPKQMLRVLIACLPKSEIAERPIALLSVFCRVWCRMRGFLVQRWQQNKGVQATWDHAVAGYSVFDAPSSRQFKAEFLGALDLQMATFFV